MCRTCRDFENELNKTIDMREWEKIQRSYDDHLQEKHRLSEDEILEEEDASDG